MILTLGKVRTTLAHDPKNTCKTLIYTGISGYPHPPLYLCLYLNPVATPGTVEKPCPLDMPSPPLGGFAPAGSYGPTGLRPRLRRSRPASPNTRASPSRYALTYSSPPQAGDTQYPLVRGRLRLPCLPVALRSTARTRPLRGSCAPPASRLPPAFCSTGRGWYRARSEAAC